MLVAGTHVSRIVSALQGHHQAVSKDVLLADNASWIFRLYSLSRVRYSGACRWNYPHAVAGTPDSFHGRCNRTCGASLRLARFLPRWRHGHRNGLRGMGSSREMTIASLAEPAMLMAIFNRFPGEQINLAFGDGACDLQRQVYLRPSLALPCLPLY